MFQVYVIRASTNGKIYIGQTEDIAKRLDQHNNRNFDKRAYTKLNGKDWKIVYTEEYQTRSEALKRENELKSHRGRDFIKNLLSGVGSSTVEQ